MQLPLQKKWLSSWPLPLIVSLLLFVVLYGLIPYTFKYNDQNPIPIFSMLWAFWSGQPDWEHGMLVMPIAFGLIYWRRDKYLAIPVRGDNRGAIILAVAFILYWVGYKGDIKPFAFFSIQLFLAGLAIWFLGWPMFKAALFPWLFITFAWPMPGLDAFVAFPLREFMSAVTYHFLNLIGIPALRVGTAVVSAPDFALNIPQGQRFALDVADPCSGIRSLFALTMVTALYSYLTLPKTWQKLTLFLCAIPLAVFGNFIRMLMLTFGTIVLGSDIAIGPADKPSMYHEMAGFAVFGAALGGMLAIGWLLEHNWTETWTSVKRWALTPDAPRSQGQK